MGKVFPVLTGAVLWLGAGMAQPAESVFPVPPGPEEQAPPSGEVPPPHRAREEIEADIRDLEARRLDLLSRYAPAHPDVRAVDRRLAILRAQLRLLEPAGPR